MVVKLADNIFSPIGKDTAENYQNILCGKSALRLYENKWDIPEPFMASLFDTDFDSDFDSDFDLGVGSGFSSGSGFAEPALARQIKQAFLHSLTRSLSFGSELTRFEKACIISAADAIGTSGIEPESDRVIFILSTTKGNIELLDSPTPLHHSRLPLGSSAKAIASYFGNKNEPIVVNNACVSGGCAQLTAKRLLDSERYDYAVVIGCEVMSKFIISGFLSLKALSPYRCQPFDMDRSGLNVGEAAATVVYGRKNIAVGGNWILEDGVSRNDAYHISSPSKTGEGAHKCLFHLLANNGISKEELAVINMHGTGTIYNDEMEAVAIDRAGLNDIPANSYKGIYGHTMGAAGVLESIITQRALDDGILLPTYGFKELGVSKNILISSNTIKTDKRAFIKMLSGFGGCNVALSFRKVKS
ncbi:MAG: beta-ketoacyl synthase [Bacteroidaceae bacterium]|nr:beta-ketoacyl synthase [Bacteroidaceae bacterium]